MKWVDKHIEVEPEKHPKKITATRLATILGKNKWSTPFEIWCAVTRTYEKPYEDTIYTLAGKAIEPKQIAYMRKSYMMDNLRTPTDIYGADYFKTTYGDFFHKTPVLGGMWDSLLVDENEEPITVLEFKTTKRSEDWKDDVPEYYAIQASLYAYLLGVDDVIMVCSFLGSSDYEHPEDFKPSAANTITVSFKVSERYPDFADMVGQAYDWWNTYVKTGISPDYDEKADEEILKVLRTNNVNPDTDVNELIEEATTLYNKLEVQKKALKEASDRLETLKNQIKEISLKLFRDGDKKVTLSNGTHGFEVTKSDTLKIDEKAMAKDGVLEKYKTLKSTTYRINPVKNKED